MRVAVDGSQRCSKLSPHAAILEGWPHTSCTRATSSMAKNVKYTCNVTYAGPKHGVIPRRRAAASPESITPGLSAQTNVAEYGFRAPAFGRPRNDALQIVESGVIYGENVIYAEDVIYAKDVIYAVAGRPLTRGLGAAARPAFAGARCCRTSARSRAVGNRIRIPGSGNRAPSPAGR
jgi:hypothetical protein